MLKTLLKLTAKTLTLLCISAVFLFFSAQESIAAVGLSVGNNTLNLLQTENLLYGNVGIGSHASSSFLLFQNNGADRFKVDISGNLTTSGSITANAFTGPLTGQLNAANVSSGQFGSNVGNGNFSFPGNVGIGVTNPSDKLDVGGNIRISGASSNLYLATGQLLITADGSVDREGSFITSSSGRKLQMGISDNSTVPVGIDLFETNNTYASTYINFRTNNANTMRLDSNGRLGIGTISPEDLLNVQGDNANIRISSATLNTGTLGLLFDYYPANETQQKTGIFTTTTGSWGRSNMYFSLNSAADSSNVNPTADAKLTILNNGNIGLGVSNPGSRLHIAGTPGSVAGSGILFSGNTAIWQAGAGDLRIRPAATDIAVFTNTGIGVGTSTIDSRLSVAGGNVFINDAAITSGTPKAAITKEYLTSALDAFNTESNLWKLNGSNLYASTTAWNVGIGTTTPAAKLHLVTNPGSNVLRVAGNNPSYYMDLVPYVISGGNYGYIFKPYGSTGYADGLVIDTVGKVGIGTTNPGTRLELTSLSGNNYPLRITTSDWVAGSIGSELEIGFLTNTGNSNAVLLPRVNGGLSNSGLLLSPYGFVGVGMTSNATSRLQVRDGANVNFRVGNIDGSGEVNLGSFTDALGYAPMRFYGSKFYFGNNVGIGTTTPGTRLTVVGSGNYSIDAGNYRVGNVATPVSALDAVNKTYLDSAVGAAQTAFWNLNGSNLYASSTSWNVGIGTTNPGLKLDVQGSARVSNVLRAGNFRHVLSSAFITTAVNGYLLTTSIPYDGLTNRGMHTVRVTGYSYGNSESIDFVVNFYLYGGGLSSYGWTNYGAYDPGTVKLSYEGNYLKIWWSNVFYYPSFEIFTTTHGSLTNTDSYFEGWTITDVAAPATNVVDVPYRNAEPQGLMMGGNISLNNNWLSGDGGNEGIFVDNSGNVGIGTTNPTARLYVNGTSIFNNIATFTQPVIVGAPVLSAHAATKNYVDSQISSSTGAIAFWGGSLAGNISNSNSGNVGIGTTTPATKLNIYGTSNTIRSSYDGTKYSEISADSSGNATWHSTGYLMMKGDSGTGDLSAVSGSSLRILGDPSGVVGNGVYLKAFKTGFPWYVGLQYLNSASIPDLVLVPNGGNVGIGTTNPTARLYVNGTSIFNNIATFTQPVIVGAPVLSAHAATKNYVDSQISSSTGAIAFWGGSLAGNISNANSGNVGIGTASPDAKINVFGAIGSGSITPQEDLLHVGGNELGGVGGYAGIRIGGTADSRYYNYIRSVKTTSYGNYWNSDLTFGVTRTGTANTFDEVMRITSGSNVGIGTASPNSRLHVYNSTANAEIDIQSLVGAGNHWGLYSNLSDNSFRLWGGSDFMTVLRTSGNVGIGTTNPGSLLTVSKGIIANIEGGAVLDSTLLIRQNTNGVGASAIEFGFGVGAGNYLGSRIVSNIVSGGGANIYFQTATSSSGTYTSKMTILRDGNVGIGTTAPATKLHVAGGARFESTTTLNDGTERLRLSWGLSPLGAIVQAGSGMGMYLGVNNSATTGIFINSSGNVGIGTTNPTARLYVNGSSIFNDVATFTQPVIVGAPVLSAHAATKNYVDSQISSSTGAIAFWGGSLAGNISNSNSGNVGIGTATPATKLQIEGSVGYHQLLQKRSGSSQALWSGAVWDSVGSFIGHNAYYSSSFNYIPNYSAASGLEFRESGNIEFFADSGLTSGVSYNPTERMIINTAGNVGIGTMGPNSRLHVYNTAANAEIDIQSLVGAGNHWGLYSNLSDNSFRLWGGSDFITVLRTSGNVGIGTTAPGAILDVRGATNGVLRISTGRNSALDTGSLDFWWSGEPHARISASASGNTSNLHFLVRDGGTTAVEKMRIASNGNVGIGTTTPGTKLTVIGSGNYSIDAGNFRVGNVATPVSPLDAVNKTYLDSAVGAAQTAFWNLNGSNLYASSTSWNVGIGTTNPNQQLEITQNFRLPTTVGTNAYGVIYKDGDRFIHNFSYGLNGNGITPDGGNTFVGVNAGNFTMGSTAKQTYQGSYNTANGYTSLRSNTTGYYNTANGSDSLRSNTTGYYNTANGSDSLYSNTTGFYNTANGYASLRSNTTGFYNTANGSASLYSNTTGFYNTANGSDSLYSNTTGFYNTANGSDSLYSNTTGSYNTANGHTSLYSNTTGSYNTANGHTSLYSNTTGFYNTANGHTSLYSNTTGFYNTALGYNSGRYLYDGISGRTTGNNGLYLGYNTKSYSNGTDNEIVIGSNAIGLGSDTAVYGNTSMVKHIFEAGNVGIGTTTPGTKLTVIGSGNYSIDAGNFRVGNVATPVSPLDAVNKTYLDSAVGAAQNAFWNLSGSNLFASSTSWNVGIGTSSPTTKLDIIGGLRTTGPLQLSNVLYMGGGNRVLMVDNAGNVSATSTAPSASTVPVFVGLTASSYNGTSGSNPGYAYANSVCAAAFSGSHVCTTYEMLNTINASSTMPTADAWVHSGPPGYTALANDCDGRRSASSAAYGAYWQISDAGYAPHGRGLLMTCNNSLQYACCK